MRISDAAFCRRMSGLESAQPNPDNMTFYFMKAPDGSKPNDGRHPVSLRSEQSGDEALLFAVFASTREEELVPTNWPEPVRRSFLNQQFNAMRQGYQSMFPSGEFLIIELNGKPIGRMVLNRDNAEIRVVDLALLPAQRNMKIGTFLMRQICADAKKPVRLSVLKNNRALHWYVRLGFVVTGERGFYEELEWRPLLT